MGRPKKDDQEFQARGCQIALDMANDAKHLARATPEQLGIAATFLARALAPFDVDPEAQPEPGECRMLPPRAVGAIRQLEATGRAIGAELRRRQLAAAFRPPSGD
jgi:hypothetical protein